MVAESGGSLQRRVEQAMPAGPADLIVLGPRKEGAESSAHRYLLVIYGNRKRIAVCAALAMLLTFVWAQFLMLRWYQAVAVIRPASQEPQTSMSLTSVLGSVMSGSASGSPLGNLFGGTASDAQELLAMLGSVHFNLRLVDRYKLAPVITRHKTILSRVLLAFSGGGSGHTNRWMLYRLMQSRLDCSYDDNSGNFTIKFIDPDPAEAERILGLYISDLRDKLRARAVESSAAAIKALQNQIAGTSDSLLISQLDQLLAQQLQTLGTAEVAADFDFVVIDPPAVPPAPYAPRPLIYALVAGLLTPLLACAFLILRERARPLLRSLQEQPN